MSLQSHSILDSYTGRHVLLTGATGFLGKILLAMMLDTFPNIGCIYVLIRKGKEQSAIERFIQEIASTPVFKPFYEKKQEEFNQFLIRYVKVIEGDITLPQLGLSPSCVTQLYSTLDLIIHAAGLVDFFPDIRSGMEINILGALNVADFVKQSHKARLIHISTCYVAGNQSGVFKETVTRDKSPNGSLLDAELELTTIVEAIERITADEHSVVSSERRFKTWGIERAAHWGWSNTYCYTKALAELLLVTRYADISLTIVRPAAIESALAFPFSGWNEGVNGTAHLSWLVGTWYRYFLFKKQNIMDLVPVDTVSHAILIIGADVLNYASSGVYHLASSSSNPCYFGLYVKLSRSWHRRQVRHQDFFGLSRYLRTLMPIKHISPNSPLSPQKLIIYLTAVDAYLIRVSRHFKSLYRVKEALASLTKILRPIDRIYRAYQPFTYDHRYIFSSQQITQLSFKENKFTDDINKINWKAYILNTHLPGLNQWIFPLFEKRKASADVTPVTLNEHEKNTLLTLIDGDPIC